MLRTNTISVANPQGRKKKFSNETPKQQAKHREIALRYGKSKEQDRLLLNIRMHELEVFFIHRHGTRELPDDDAGRDYLRVMIDHLLLRGEDYVYWRVRDCAPWVSESELNEMIERGGNGRWWHPQVLANELRLDSATRLLLDIRTFRACDKTTAELAADRAARKAAAEAERRRNKGAIPREMSEARLKPWVALGESESTYRRRNRKNKSGDSNSCSISLQSLCGTKYGHGAPPPQGGSEARAVPTLSDVDTIISTEKVFERCTPLLRARTPLPLAASSSM